jgi:hypothetical protein
MKTGKLDEAFMRMSLRLCALLAAFGIFSTGVVSAAAFLPLERLGRSPVIALQGSFLLTHSNKSAAAL